MPANPHNCSASAQPAPTKTRLGALANVVLSLLATAGLCAAFLYWRASPSANERLLATIAAVTAMPAGVYVLVTLGELFAPRPIRRAGRHGLPARRGGPARRLVWRHRPTMVAILTRRGMR